MDWLFLLPIRIAIGLGRAAAGLALRLLATLLAGLVALVFARLSFARRMLNAGVWTGLTLLMGWLGVFSPGLVVTILIFVWYSWITFPIRRRARAERQYQRFVHTLEGALTREKVTTKTRTTVRTTKESAERGWSRFKGWISRTDFHFPEWTQHPTPKQPKPTVVRPGRAPQATLDDMARQQERHVSTLMHPPVQRRSRRGRT